MVNFFKVFQHLLPRSRAWKLSPGKTLTKLFEALAALPDNFKVYIDLIFLDIFPLTTREVDQWSTQFGYPDSLLTEDEKRSRLAAAWNSLGGQSPRYIQDTLQAAGFDVYVHEWWVPNTHTPRNPLTVLHDTSGRRNFYIICSDDYGTALGVCGYAGAVCGSSPDPLGYPLVNKLLTAYLAYIDCLNVNAICGNANAVCGASYGFKYNTRKYIIPSESIYWHYFVYIGGENYPDLATVDAGRRDEFETLLLKICPNHLWIGVLVNYV